MLNYEINPVRWSDYSTGRRRLSARLSPRRRAPSTIRREAGYASACFTRSGVKGSARRRLPVAFAMALAIAAAAGP